MLVHTTPGTAAALRQGEDASLATSLVVREDALTLYGFGTEDERAVFEQVQTVSGVGPRLALAMLAVHSPAGLRAAIGGSDIASLTKVPGVGRKGAERIVLELRDKVGMATGSAGAGAVPPAPVAAWREQVTEALVGLGWNAKQAEGAVSAVADGAGDDVDVSQMLRAALRELGR